MTKNEFLLSIVIDFIEDAKGTCQEIGYILEEEKYLPEIEKHYGAKHPANEQYEEGTHEERIYWTNWENSIDTIISDAMNLLISLKDAFSPKSNGWLFMQCPDEEHYCIVKESFWDACGEEKYLDDRSVGCQLQEEGIDMHGFHESCESEYEYNGPYEEGVQKLISMGFKEVENPFDYDEDE